MSKASDNLPASDLVSLLTIGGIYPYRPYYRCDNPGKLGTNEAYIAATWYYLSREIYLEEKEFAYEEETKGNERK